MNITHTIVEMIANTTKCPILEMWKSPEDGRWFCIFDEYTCIEGKDQIVHLDETLEMIQQYDNVEYLTHEVYIDDNRENTYYEQISFQWSE